MLDEEWFIEPLWQILLIDMTLVYFEQKASDIGVP